jgi:transposase
VSETPTPYQEYVEQPEALIGLLIEKDQEIAKLQRHICNMNKARFGARSEKLEAVTTEQLSLLSNGEVPAPEVTTPPVKLTVPAHTRSARVKRDLSKLPHNRIEHLPESTTCACCGLELVRIGEDVSTVLEYEPAKLYVNEHVRGRYACTKCKDGVHQAELPAVKPLYRSLAGVGLLTYVLIAKYVDHLPLHRLEQIFARNGLQIPRRNLCDWVGGVVDQYLERLWVALKKEMLKLNYLQGDETTLKVQDGETPGKCHLGYLWGMVSPERKFVLFEYAPGRAGEVAKEIFDGLEGFLQTDAYAGYNAVGLPDKVVRVACLAHVRRRFIEAEKSCSKESTTILTLIAELYKLEKSMVGLDPPERLAERAKHSKPVLKKLEVYLRQLKDRTLPKAPLMEAINYALNQWAEIERIFDDGRFHLDNNMIEREMRPIAVGRKNYLFAGSHEGAKRAAIIYSLFATARLHKVNPQEWLKDVLTRMLDSKVPDVAQFLPHNWIKAKVAA